MPPNYPPADKTTWRSLLQPALSIVDSLRDQGYGDLAFRFGGGTVLMLRWDHRISKDIDLFLHDAQALGYLTPRLNELAARMAPQYVEAANAIKLQLPQGDIDFIVAGDLFPRLEPEVIAFEGRTIKLDRTEEILGKKLMYRAESFKPRDVFDMAAGLIEDPVAVGRALRVTHHVHPTLIRRLNDLRGLSDESLMRDIVFTRHGAAYFTDMVERVRAAVNDVSGEDVNKLATKTS